MIATDEHFLSLHTEIFKYCQNLTKNYHKRNDLYQDVYLNFRIRMYHKEFESLEHLEATIKRGVFWIYANSLRSKYHNKFYDLLRDDHAEYISDLQYEQSGEYNVRDILYLIENYHEKKLRTYLLLFIEGYQMKEIAKMYNDNIDSVQKKINTLRKLLLTNKYISYKHKEFKELNKIDLSKVNRRILVFKKDKLDTPIGNYKSLKDVIKDYPQLNPQEISRILNNRSFSAKGYTFKYTRQL